MNLSRRQLITYGTLASLSLLLLPIFPLVIGPYIAYRLFKKAPTKKKGLAYVTLTVIVAFFAAGVTASALPNFYGEPSPKEERQEVKDEAHTDQKPEVEGIDTSNVEGATAPNNSNIVHEKVAFVIDGDTFELENGDRVRFIGIDTPETPNDCYSREATNKTKELIDGAIVGLEKDVSETDKYGRLLRYVYMGDLLINDVLVREGFASAVSYPPDVRFQDQFGEAEREARENNRGLWEEACQATPKPTVKPTVKSTAAPVYNPPTTVAPTTAPSNSGGSVSGHSCSGPDLDCSDFATHAQAQQFFDNCGFTANYDPMRLDAVGVGDGIACESLP